MICSPCLIESKAPGISQKGLVVETHVPADLTVSGESFLLHQAVSNLVGNAVDFSPAKSKDRFLKHPIYSAILPGWHQRSA